MRTALTLTADTVAGPRHRRSHAAHPRRWRWPTHPATTAPRAPETGTESGAAAVVVAVTVTVVVVAVAVAVVAVTVTVTVAAAEAVVVLRSASTARTLARQRLHTT